MNQLPRVVLFDDDESNHKHYKNILKDDFLVTSFTNPYEFEHGLKEDPSLYLVDVHMPLLDGFELARLITSHQDYNGSPVIFISASRSEEVLHGALNNGGQDFLGILMNKSEVLIRMHNKIKHAQTSRQIFKLGDIKLTISELRAYNVGVPLDLTLIEFKILRILLREYPKPKSRNEFSEEIWSSQVVLPGTINVHLSNLRSKIKTWDYEILNSKESGIVISRKVLMS